MRKLMLVGIAGFAAIQVSAAGLGLKPGLWETKIVKQVVDGRDVSAQMADAASKMQAAMANMPPEQRARMEAMMKQRGGPTMTGNATIKICVGPEGASGAKPPPTGPDRCQPANVTHSGNRTLFSVSCASNGSTTTGKGEITTVGDVMSTVVDLTRQRPDGSTHVIHNESQMTYLGADCGDLKPASILSEIR